MMNVKILRKKDHNTKNDFPLMKLDFQQEHLKMSLEKIFIFLIYKIEYEYD